MHSTKKHGSYKHIGNIISPNQARGPQITYLKHLTEGSLRALGGVIIPEHQFAQTSNAVYSGIANSNPLPHISPEEAEQFEIKRKNMYRRRYGGDTSLNREIYYTLRGLEHFWSTYSASRSFSFSFI